jgi:flagellar hook-length control protein FliK
MSSVLPSGSSAGLAAAPGSQLGGVAAPVAEARIPVPLDSPAFAPALGAQVSVFARDGVQTALLQLNPAEMGPISVLIAVDGNGARVDFQADLAATRDVIEASLPALAGALQEAGLTLTGGGVFQQPQGRQNPPDAPPAGAATTRIDRDPAATDSAPPTAPQRTPRRGLVDLVA